MHASCLIIIKADLKDGTSEEYVSMAMNPFQEEDSNGWWDWFVIGGRWSGQLSRIKLDPEKLKEFGKQVEEQGLNWVSKDKPENLQNARAKELWHTIFGEDSEPLVGRDRYEGFYEDDVQEAANFTEEELKRLNTASVVIIGEEMIADHHSEKWVDHSWETDDNWDKDYYTRFLANLDPNDRLVIVDYHS